MICAAKWRVNLAAFLLLGCLIPTRAQSQVVVTLSSPTAPSSGQAGLTTIDVIGANFPSGTIPPGNVTVTLQPGTAGPPSATATASAVSTIAGTARRVFFVIPSSLLVASPTAYKVSVSGTTSAGVAFQSGNTAALTINPPAQIVSVQPSSGQAGNTVTVTVTGLYTTFTQGATLLSAGPGIAVNGAAEGAFGTAAVGSTTSITATLVIDPSAAAGPRTISVQTGAQQATLANGFTVSSPLIPPTANPGGPYTGNINQAISFNGGNSTAAAGQTITSYAWNFGDGSTGTGSGTSHTYTSPGSFPVSLTVTDSLGLTSTATTTAGIFALPVANAGGPYNGTVNQAVSLSASASTAPAGETLTSFSWNFGDGSTQTTTTAAVNHTYSSAGTFTVTVTVSDTTGGTGSATTTVTVANAIVPPTISGFSPLSGPIGTLIVVSGANFNGSGSSTPAVTLARQGGGTVGAPLSSFTGTSISFVIPTGAASGALVVSVGNQTATSTDSLTITPSSTFSLGLTPSSNQLIQGQSTAYSVALSSTDGFSGLATLSVTGLPSGVTSAFKPATITAGQSSVLTLSAPISQPIGNSNISVTASATVNGLPVTQTAAAALQVTAVTTSFLGRTVVDDTSETPIAGVTITFLGKDSTGRVTGCSGQTLSDGAGNFSFTGLPAACTGPQLISYDGLTATAPKGTFAGVDLSYTLTSGQVTTSPVLIHLPRIDNAETVHIKQNASVTQEFSFTSEPYVRVTVYPGTTFTMQDGTQPDPFPLVAVAVPVDRLPDLMPTSGMLTPYIAAFQPANAIASQPVAVTFPNPLSVPAGQTATLMTLDPSRGFMVPYGTATVSADGTEFIPDPDPNHPGHRYGLVHFDWHGPAAPPGGGPDPGGDGGGDGGGAGGGGGSGGGGDGPPPSCACDTPPAPQSGDPIDLSSGIQIVKATDITIKGARASIAMTRIYRSMSPNAGPFGVGTNHTYGYELDDSQLIRNSGTSLKLVTPDGNQFLFNKLPDGTFTNTTVPSYQGAVITNPSSGVFLLRQRNGTTLRFQTSSQGPLLAFLSSITDRNGNAITLTRNSSNPLQLTQISDPVGRSLTLTYDSSNRITTIVDPIGRTVSYTYGSNGKLATVTDTNGGVTSFTYDTSNNLTQMTDQRGVVMFQNTYDANGRVVQQQQADGGIFQYAYTLLNASVPTSPVLQTVVTDPLGNQTTYHFSPAGYLLDVTDAAGQTRTLARDNNNNNKVQGYSGTGSCPSCGKQQNGSSSFTFDAAGNMLTWTDALGNTTSFTYDPTFNKPTSITDPLGNVTKLTYDSRGNLLSKTDAGGHTTTLAYNSFGQLIQATDPAGANTTFTYDGTGNLSQITDSLGNKTSFAYDAISQLLSVTDSLGRTGTLSYDGMGRITRLVDPKGESTQFNYDPSGNLISVTGPAGNKSTFSYDSENRVVTRTDPLGKSETGTYDLNGNLIKLVDRRGQTSQFTYDALNRLTSQTYQDGSKVSRAYDAAGRLASVTDSLSGTFAFTFDAAGHMTKSSTQFGTVQYAYDAAGRLSSREVVGQSPVQYSYDAAGNMTGASLPQASANFTYDPVGRMLNISRGNGVSTGYSYDIGGRIQSIIHSGPSGTLNSQSYTYDPTGKRPSLTTDIAQALTTPATSNTFDAGNRLLTSGGKSYAYDANGNLVSITDSNGSTTLTWDARNRLQSISLPSGQKTSFLYDFATNMIQQQDAGPALNLTQNFVLDRQTNLSFVGRSDGDNWSMLTGQTIDQNLAVVHSTGGVEFTLADANNSTVATTDQTGALKSTFFYEPYGQTTASGAYASEYTGRLQVSQDIYYYRARYYDPSTGRFLSEDPAGINGGSTNLYAYAGEDPINRRDPSGLQPNFGIPPITCWICTGGLNLTPITPPGPTAPPIFPPACPPGSCSAPGPLPPGPLPQLPFGNGWNLTISGDPSGKNPDFGGPGNLQLSGPLGPGTLTLIGGNQFQLNFPDNPLGPGAPYPGMPPNGTPNFPIGPDGTPNAPSDNGFGICWSVDF